MCFVALNRLGGPIPSCSLSGVSAQICLFKLLDPQKLEGATANMATFLRHHLLSRHISILFLVSIPTLVSILTTGYIVLHHHSVGPPPKKNFAGYISVFRAIPGKPVNSREPCMFVLHKAPCFLNNNHVAILRCHREARGFRMQTSRPKMAPGGLLWVSHGVKMEGNTMVSPSPTLNGWGTPQGHPEENNLGFHPKQKWDMMQISSTKHGNMWYIMTHLRYSAQHVV